jgi:hypothetical protein
MVRSSAEDELERIQQEPGMSFELLMNMADL